MYQYYKSLVEPSKENSGKDKKVKTEIKYNGPYTQKELDEMLRSPMERAQAVKDANEKKMKEHEDRFQSTKNQEE